MKFLSLFSGIGGFDLGLERAGMQCVGQVEKDKFCQRVLAHHWPEVKRVEDIYNVTGADFEPVELICGGFPCQPFSTAGKRGGKNDDRYLWPEMLRVIEAYKPAWVLGENVAGIVSMALDTVLSDLENKGYTCQAFIIPACAVDAKHERKRVWIVGRNSDSMRCGRNCRAFRTVQNENTNTDRVCENVADTQSRGSGRGLCEAGQEQNRNQLADSGSHVSDTNSERGCLRNSEREDAEDVGQPSRCEERRVWLPEPGVGRVANGVPGRVDRLRSLGNAVDPQVVEVIGRAIQRAHIVCAECAPENTSEARFTASQQPQPNSTAVS